MIKKFIIACLYCFSAASFACSGALPTDHAGFCASFKATASCYCTASGMPAGMCQDMNALYRRMTSVFGSLEGACRYQKNTTYQQCMDDWTCYRSGGTDSRGKLCSSTGLACQ